MQCYPKYILIADKIKNKNTVNFQNYMHQVFQSVQRPNNLKNQKKRRKQDITESIIIENSPKPNTIDFANTNILHKQKILAEDVPHRFPGTALANVYSVCV